VKSFQAGLENMMFGPAGPIRGQLGLCALLHEALTPHYARLLHQTGCNSRALFVTDSASPTDFQDMANRLVFCFSPAACWNNLCLDLAPGNKYDGHVVATQCQTLNIKVKTTSLRWKFSQVYRNLLIRRTLFPNLRPQEVGWI